MPFYHGLKSNTDDPEPSDFPNYPDKQAWVPVACWRCAKTFGRRSKKTANRVR